MQQEDFLNDIADILKPWSDLESAAVRLLESNQLKNAHESIGAPESGGQEVVTYGSIQVQTPVSAQKVSSSPVEQTISI